jgi:hypothetical protein
MMGHGYNRTRHFLSLNQIFKPTAEGFLSVSHNLWWYPAFRNSLGVIRPLLLSGGQRSWLQIKRSGFDSRRYQVF